ncbi:Spy/CpxP family protein refolding chaperone [Polaribacter sp. Z022]|uniref:Spy/CpxP family protein refolding chaperone n=1 Tax=Polaribacter sp. Z022 TaxID=2927125 RepID=UPI0020202F9A|nr:Spy/CpxP family protein refolding chaperone [Polaribacter sp. Z022]MCL7753917.1 Spy/CpxP family protein refolding chaperone [Polaribacter sp. Z022]
MRNIITILVLVFAFTLNTQAQKKGGKASVEKMLQKMTKSLNLTEAQQSKIKPLLVAQLAERKAMNEKRKALKESGQKPSKEVRQKLRSERLANETEMNTKMAAILDAEQLAKFKSIAKKRKEKAKEKMKNRKL